MKELTTEQKAKRYDEALERASKLRVQNPFDTVSQMMEHVFPELKESEDERIKKVLIGWFKRYKEEDICGSETFNEIPTDNILAWLEKQGEHANFRNKIQIGDKVTRNEDGMLVNMSQFKRIAKKNEKQDEQKPADEAEPKFKVGDWVVDKIGTVKQILSYRDCIYKHTDGYSSKMFEDEWRLWDITKDAKEGDVLIHNECTFIFMGIKDGIVQALEENLLDGTNPVPFGEPSKDKDYYPATKEQRDALEKAIADAGYAFDFEKKELKKIEQKLADKPKFKVKYAGSEYNVFKIKDIAGITFYGIEDEPNHIDYVLPDNCEIVSGYSINENGFSFPTKPIMFSEQKPV